ncbi:MAG TPA: AIM24 family protein [Pseudonocardiaceae bacterium]
MQVRTRHTPTFGVARLLLAPREMVCAGPSTLLASSYGVGVKPASETPFKQMVRPWKEAMAFAAPADGGWVDVAPRSPGDLYVLDLDGSKGWCVARDGWLAMSGTVQLEASWSGFQDMFGGQVGFLLHATGTGSLVLSCCGQLDIMNLTSGDLVSVDPGHVVAYPDKMRCRLRAMSQSGPQSVRTGEGLLLDFVGPGRLVTQTRSPRAMAAWLASRTNSGRA